MGYIHLVDQERCLSSVLKLVPLLFCIVQADEDVHGLSYSADRQLVEIMCRIVAMRQQRQARKTPQDRK